MITRLRRIGNITIVLIVPLALASCDDNRPAMLFGSGITGPSNVAVAQSSGVFNISPMLVPSTIPFHTLPVSGCPLASPFATSFSLIIDQRGGLDVFMHEVGFRFFDGAGFDSPFLFGQRDLATQFGSTLVVGGTSRTFAFEPRFGCGLRSTPHSMILRLLLLDRLGRTHERTLTAHAQAFGGSR